MVEVLVPFWLLRLDSECLSWRENHLVVEQISQVPAERSSCYLDLSTLVSRQSVIYDRRLRLCRLVSDAWLSLIFADFHHARFYCKLFNLKVLTLLVCGGPLKHRDLPLRGGLDERRGASLARVLAKLP